MSVLFDAGSEKQGMFRTKRSCPAPQGVAPPDTDHHNSVILERKSQHEKVPAGKFKYPNVWRWCPVETWLSLMSALWMLFLTTDKDWTECVVCMERKATITLTCGHQCLCQNCSGRIILEFGCCPLCRHVIRSPLKMRWRSLWSYSVMGSQLKVSQPGSDLIFNGKRHFIQSWETFSPDIDWRFDVKIKKLLNILFVA